MMVILLGEKEQRTQTQVRVVPVLADKKMYDFLRIPSFEVLQKKETSQEQERDRG